MAAKRAEDGDPGGPKQLSLYVIVRNIEAGAVKRAERRATNIEVKVWWVRSTGRDFEAKRCILLLDKYKYIQMYIQMQVDIYM